MKALLVAFALLFAVAPLQAAKHKRTPKSANARGYKAKRGKGNKASHIKKANRSRSRVN